MRETDPIYTGGQYRAHDTRGRLRDVGPQKVVLSAGWQFLQLNSAALPIETIGDGKMKRMALPGRHFYTDCHGTFFGKFYRISHQV